MEAVKSQPLSVTLRTRFAKATPFRGTHATTRSSGIAIQIGRIGWSLREFPVSELLSRNVSGHARAAGGQPVAPRMSSPTEKLDSCLHRGAAPLSWPEFSLPNAPRGDTRLSRCSSSSGGAAHSKLQKGGTQGTAAKCPLPRSTALPVLCSTRDEPLLPSISSLRSNPCLLLHSMRSWFSVA